MLKPLVSLSDETSLNSSVSDDFGLLPAVNPPVTVLSQSQQSRLDSLHLFQYKRLKATWRLEPWETTCGIKRKKTPNFPIAELVPCAVHDVRFEKGDDDNEQ